MSVDPFLVAVGVGLCVIAGAGLERRTGLPLPVFLVPAGVGLAYVPGVPAVLLDPNVVFYVFLPPLIYSAAFFTTPREWRANWRPIALLATGLVVATVFATAAATASAVGGLGWAAAFVLGAVVSPTDPVAATGVIGRLGAPARLRTVLEGESLVNDAVALVVYSVAVSAAVSGRFSVGHAALQFLEEVAGGLAIGLAVGWGVVLVRRRVHDPMIEITISLLTPYLAYVPAQQGHVSGVLATVTAGVVLGSQSEGIFRPQVRVQSFAFWQVLSFLFESVLFVLLGTQFPHVVGGLPYRGLSLAGWAAVAIAVVLGIRLLWQAAAPGVVRAWRERLVVGWSGMRGAVTLAAALSVPAAVPGRSLVLFLAFAVVLATILLQGMTLPLLVRRLGLRSTDRLQRRELEARARLAEAALARLDELAADEQVDPRRVEPLRAQYLERLERATGRLEEGEDGADAARQGRELERELLAAQRRMLRRLVEERALDGATARELQRELDFAEVRGPKGGG